MENMGIAIRTDDDVFLDNIIVHEKEGMVDHNPAHDSHPC